MTGAFNTSGSTTLTLSWTDESASGAVNYKVLEWDPSIPAPVPSSDITIIYNGPNLTAAVTNHTTGTYAYEVVAENSNGDDSPVSNDVIADYDTQTITTDPTVAVVGSAIVGTSTVG